jgi:hypothetical protein
VRLRELGGEYAVCRLDPGDALPPWADGAGFSSVTRTAYELSIVCEQSRVPEDVRAERGWHAFEVAGPLDFALTGILASLAAPLADAGVSVFAVATYDTDYVLVRDVDAAREALRRAGHEIEDG